MVTEHLLCEARSRDGVLSWRCSVRARFLARVLRAAPGSGSCGGAHPAGEVSLESANALHVLLALLGLAVLEGGDFLWFHRLLYPALAPVLLLGTAAFASVAFTPSRIARVLWLGAAGVYLVLAIRTAISGDLVARARGVHEQHRAESRAARVFRSALLPDESLAIGSAGRFVYESSPSYAYDFYGLVEPDVARAPAIDGRPGHRRRSADLLWRHRPDFVVFTTTTLSQAPPCALLAADAFTSNQGEHVETNPTNLFARYVLDRGYHLVLISVSRPSGDRYYLPLLSAPRALSRLRSVPLIRLRDVCAGSATTGSSKRAPASFRITPDALLVCARTSAESFADIMRVSASARHQ